MNNKFKRFNKILMMTVAILLCFVLISTSVVSGIFAKYVITKSASAEVSLKAFGVTLTVDGMASDTSKGITKKVVKEDSNKKALEVTVTGISLAPTDSLDDIVKFTIAKDTNGPNVSKIKLKIKTAVTGAENFEVKTADLANITPENITITTKKYIPFLFTMECGSANSAAATTILSAWQTPDNSTKLAEAITDGIDANTTWNFSSTSGVEDTVEKNLWTKGTTTDLTVKYLSFGFKCWGSTTDGSLPSGSGINVTQADLIQTYLSTNSAAKLTVTYTVSLEQDLT